MNGVRVVAVSLAVALLATVAPPTAPASADPPVQLAVWPAAGEIVEGPDVRVGAATPTEGVDVELRVDGAPLATQRTGAGTGQEAIVGLAIGDHVAEARIDGRTARLWRFTVSDQPILRQPALEPTRLAAVLAHQQSDGRPVDGAVLVRDDDVADALGGAALAAVGGVPLLATGSDALDPNTAEALTRLVEPGGTVRLLGGEAALGPAVARAVEDLGLTPVRHAGADRYATAAAVADALPPSDTAYVVSGTSHADALTASGPAAADGAPILLTTADRLPGPTAEALRRRDVRRIVIVGGEAVVGPAVAEQLAETGAALTRIAGPSRAETAAALAASRTHAGGGVALAGSDDPLATLLAARDAAAADRPLLLSDGGRLDAPARAVLATRPAGPVVLYGDPEAVPDAIGRTARAAMTDREHAVHDLRPAPGDEVDPGPLVVTAAAGWPVNAAASSLRAWQDGQPVPVQVDATADDDGAAAHSLRAIVAIDRAALGPDGAELRLVGLVADPDAATFAHLDWTVRIRGLDDVFATVGGVDVHLPSTDVELIGFHESGHDGAQAMTWRDNATPAMTMPSRGRPTPRTSAADIAANPDQPVLAPVTGTVVRAGTYQLYCRHTDHYLVIDPDQHPGWEVKLLHFTDLAVAAGDRVVGGQTPVGSGPRTLPFPSQIDHYTDERNWPHVHVEVVDPSIPDVGSGC